MLGGLDWGQTGVYWQPPGGPKTNFGYNLQFRFEAINVRNHTNFGNRTSIVFSGNNYNPSAGLITQTATRSRELQFALRLSF